jgi:hypothetical protein
MNVRIAAAAEAEDGLAGGVELYRSGTVTFDLSIEFTYSRVNRDGRSKRNEGGPNILGRGGSAPGARFRAISGDF